MNNDTKILFGVGLVIYLTSFLILGLKIFAFSLVFHIGLLMTIHYSRKIDKELSQEKASSVIQDIVKQAEELINEGYAIENSDNVISLSVEPKETE